MSSVRGEDRQEAAPQSMASMSSTTDQACPRPAPSSAAVGPNEGTLTPPRQQPTTYHRPAMPFLYAPAAPLLSTPSPPSSSTPSSSSSSSSTSSSSSVPSSPADSWLYTTVPSMPYYSPQVPMMHHQPWMSPAGGGGYVFHPHVGRPLRASGPPMLLRGRFAGAASMLPANPPNNTDEEDLFMMAPAAPSSAVHERRQHAGLLHLAVPPDDSGAASVGDDQEQAQQQAYTATATATAVGRGTSAASVLNHPLLLSLPPSPFRRHFHQVLHSLNSSSASASSSAQADASVAEDSACSSGRASLQRSAPPSPSVSSAASIPPSPVLCLPSRSLPSTFSSVQLSMALSASPPRVALYRLNAVSDTAEDYAAAAAAGCLPGIGSISATTAVVVGPGGAGGDIIIDDEVWPWSPGETLEEVFEEEGIEIGVVDTRGRRARRTKLPLVLRDGWKLIVTHPLTNIALAYTLVRDTPYGVGRDPSEYFGEEILLRIFSFLDVRALCTVASVSHSWKRISEDNSLWREKCFRAKPFLKDMLVRVAEEKKAPWRSLYRALVYPHRWSKDRKPNGIKVTNEGRTAKVKGPTSTNVSIQTSRPLKAGAEPFWYFETIVDKKPTPWNIGFGIADCEWSLEIKFVGFDKDSFNYGYTSNGKMRATTQYDGFTTYGQGDRVGFWLEYFYPQMDFTIHVFLNDRLIHSWDHVYEKHKPPLYFTATLYQDGTQVSLTSDSLSSASEH